MQKVRAWFLLEHVAAGKNNVKTQEQKCIYLQDRVVDMHGERLCHQMTDHGLVLPLELASLKNPVELSVSPVDLVLKDGEGVWVEQVVVLGYHLLPSTPVIVAEVDEIQLGVCKVDPLGGDVQGQAVGPVDLGADDGLPQGPVHPDPLDPRVLAPVSPEQPAGVGRRVQAQAPRLRDVLLVQQVGTLTQFTL